MQANVLAAQMEWKVYRQAVNEGISAIANSMTSIYTPSSDDDDYDGDNDGSNNNE